jgi:LPXTG-motif cell wall-anchored protein
MKKAISLLLVLVVALSLSVVTFAATDYPGIGTNNFAGNTGIAGTNNLAGNTGTAGANHSAGNTGIARSNFADNSDIIFLPEPGELGSEEAGNPQTFALRTPTGTPNVTTVTVNAGELFIADTKNSVVVGTDTVLKPNETYKFDVYYATSAITASDAAVISASQLVRKGNLGSTGSVKFRTIKGSSSIQSTKVRTKGSGNTQSYYVEISTRNLYGTKINDVEYDLSATISGTPPAAPLAITPTASTNTFRVGFMTIEDNETDVGEEGTIVIYNDAPVILKEQFSDIAKSANYKNVTFEGEEGTWSFKGKVAGMRDTNFYYDFDPDTDLLNKFPEHEFKFLSFRAGVNFPTTGEMRIDVSDVSDTFRTMYAYLYRDGKLTEINGAYDSSTDELVFRTNYLGKFIITNQAITDTSLIEEPEFPEEEPAIPIPPTTNNPHTGAAASTNVMVALGLVSLASAAAVSRKRK